MPYVPQGMQWSKLGITAAEVSQDRGIIDEELGGQRTALCGLLLPTPSLLFPYIRTPVIPLITS